MGNRLRASAKIVLVFLMSVLASCGNESLVESPAPIPGRPTLSGNVVDNSGAPIQGATIHLQYNFVNIERIAPADQAGSSAIQRDSVLDFFVVEHDTCEWGVRSHLWWQRIPSAPIFGFKVYSDAFLSGFPMKINNGILSADVNSFIVSEANSYILGVVLTDGQEVQFVPFGSSDAPWSPSEDCGLVMLPGLAMAVGTPSVADTVTGYFTVPSSGDLKLALLYDGYPSMLIFSRSFPAGRHAFFLDFSDLSIPSGIHAFRLNVPGEMIETEFFLNRGHDASTDSQGSFIISHFQFGDTLNGIDFTFVRNDSEITDTHWEYVGRITPECIDLLTITHPDYATLRMPVGLREGQDLALPPAVLQTKTK